MNNAIRRAGAVLAVLLVALIVNINIQQVILADEIRNKPGNQRTLLSEYDRERGPILVGLDPVARSIPTDDQYKYLRTYQDGPLYAPVTGFYSILYGATQIEGAENSVLAGTSDLFFVDRIQQLLSGGQPKGGAVSLTINAAAQQAAFKGLGNKVGSVTAIEPTTGAILAMVSTPSFDPNKIATHDVAESQKEYNKLEADPQKPMLNRSLQQTPPPGSTFKLVTSAAALTSGNYKADTELPAPAKFKLPQSSREVGNWQGGPCASGSKVTLEQALAVSCNTAFLYLGNQLGQDALRAQAEKFGFNNRFTTPMVAARSIYPQGMDAAQTAMSAIGQYNDTATSLQMAMVGAAIGNGGVTMNPYLVKDIRGADLQVVQAARPTPFATALSPENAASLMSMMVNVVENGTGGNARINGVQVGGKTGTAETGEDRPAVAWFVAVAPADNPKVAVAVTIEDAGIKNEISGNALAAPIARSVIEAILNGQ